MIKRFLLTALLLSWATARAQQPCGQQLLLNPGCEEPLVGGDIPGWHPSVSLPETRWTARSASPPPPPDGGLFYFSAESVTAGTPELIQKMFIAARPDSIYSWGAEIWTTAQTSSTAQIVIIARDANNSVRVVQDMYDIATGGQWESVRDTLVVPWDITSLEVHLITHGHGVHFDNVFLTADCQVPVVPLTWGRLKAGRR